MASAPGWAAIMKKRCIVGLIILAMVYLVILGLAGPLRLILFGLLANETSYKGRPTRYWSYEVRAWTHSRSSVRRDPWIEKLIRFLNLGHKFAKPKVLDDGHAAKPMLIELLKDEDAKVRQEAVIRLGNLGILGKDAIPALTEALNDQDTRVRLRATQALMCIGPKSVMAIVEALKDNDASVRYWAIFALGQIGPRARAAVPALVEILKHADKSTRLAVAEALMKIDPQTARKQQCERVLRERQEEEAALNYSLEGRTAPLIGP